MFLFCRGSVVGVCSYSGGVWCVYGIGKVFMVFIVLGFSSGFRRYFISCVTGIFRLVRMNFRGLKLLGKGLIVV